MTGAGAAAIVLSISLTSALLDVSHDSKSQDQDRLEDTSKNTLPDSEIGGPDMIKLYQGVDIPGPIPDKKGAGWADGYRRGEFATKCKVEHNEGNVYSVRDPRMKPFLLQNTNNSNGTGQPVVIIAPGSRHTFLAWEREGTSVAKWLNSIGMSAFVLASRVPTNSKGALIDTQRAISLVRHNAESYGIDPARIIFMEFGGRTAGDLAITKKRLYAPLDESDKESFEPNYVMMIYAIASPRVFFFSPKPPPAFVVVVEDDPCTENNEATKAFCAAAQNKKQECEQHEYKSGGHGVGTCESYVNTWSEGGEVCEWIEDARAWFEKHGML